MNHAFAWQGWRLDLPARWNPVKLEGGYDEGMALFADLQRPRLGMRWKRAGRRLKPEAWVSKTLRAEVGQLAAEQARQFPIEQFEAGTMFVEPEPPGRDVWLGVSRRSHRVLEVVYHAKRREHPLATMLLPSLVDQSPEEPAEWAVFDLSCVVPAGMGLEKHLLNAGDLSLSFADRKTRQHVTVRQIAVAELALKRMSIDRWLIDQERRMARFYRPKGEAQGAELDLEDRSIKGNRRILRRRWRYFWMRSAPREFVTYALHDEGRDRLVIIQATDESLAREVLPTVGWAKPGET